MSSSSLAARYAIALISIGEDKGNREQLGRELSRVSTLFSSQELIEVFKSPKFDVGTRAKVIRDLLAKLVVSPICTNFCLLLNDKNRFLRLPEIERSYQKLSDSASGRMRAEVLVAEALTDVEVTRIRLTLQAATGKEVLVEQMLEPEIIGGVVTRLDGRVFDGSVRKQLSSLKKALIG
jgi:F-type H+-transporting ATPase subunit delta